MATQVMEIRDSLNRQASPLDCALGREVKSTWITRRMPREFPFSWGPVGSLTVGDVLLCEVIAPSLHSRIEARSGVRVQLYPGDLIVCALGNRYATSFFEGVAETRGENAHLLSSSGLCGLVRHQNEKVSRPTSIRVIGQAVAAGGPVNLRSFVLGTTSPPHREPAWILVIGSAMDSGKTTVCTSLIHGLADAGLRVGAAKLTGTASTRDLSSFHDAGANPTLDFLDCGWPSTAGCSVAELTAVSRALLDHLRAAELDVAVLEIADGLLQSETAALLGELRGRLTAPAVVFTASEALAGVAGVERLHALGYRVATVSGVVTNSALARREIEQAVGIHCIVTADLAIRAASLVGLVNGYRPTDAQDQVA